MPGLKGRPWRRICKLVRESSSLHVCHVCRQPIDMALHYNDPLAFTVDHLRARVLGGSWYDLRNLAPAHRRCNSSKGGRSAPSRPRMTREW